jgi:glucose/arabinose dehydrogenase
VGAAAIINLGIIAVVVVAIAVMLAGRLLDGDDPPSQLVDLTVRLEAVASGFDSPLLLVGAGDGSADRFVVEQRGLVVRLRPDGSVDEVPFLDIRDRVLDHHERGLLGLAFHPAYGENGRFFVVYSRRDDGATSVSEFTAPRGSEGEAAGDPTPVEATERAMLTIPQISTMHKGGMLAFDDEGMLLVSVGDGSTGNDPDGNALDPASLLGKLLRLDVDRGYPYATPPDNGFAEDPEARAEVHAIGLRNPWRFSVDRETGDVYIGDVGQGDWEEIDVLPRGAREASFGWADMEGEGCFYGRPCDPEAHTAPAVTYAHVEDETGHCGVIGGYVYRGAAATVPAGTYLYADYCSGTVWAVPVEQLQAGDAAPAVVGRVPPELGLVRSFGQDDAGELYLVTDAGHVLGITATQTTAAPE